MKTLINMEFYKFFKNKFFIVSFLIIPILSVVVSRRVIESLVTSANMVNYGSLPYLALDNKVYLLLWILIIYYNVSSITEEMSSGELRITLAKGVEKHKLIIAKVIVLLIVLAIYLFMYGICVYIYGLLSLGGESYILVHSTGEKVVGISAIIYTIKFYFLSYSIAVSFMSIITFISVLSKNTLIASGCSMGFFLINIVIPDILFRIIKNEKVLEILKHTSLYSIQYFLKVFLNNAKLDIAYTLMSLLLYIVIFYSISFYTIKKENYLN
ncbi:ABC transporter permease subunit [Hathewaya histolytica]|uniref:ABC transporter permease subunit n=1 Tax=Hathewaya histolytica TaxID=1498 RepID=UPI003B676731